MDILVGCGLFELDFTRPFSFQYRPLVFLHLIMLAVAAGLAASKGYTHIALGSHMGDHAIYPDCRMGFVEAMGNAINQGTWDGLVLSHPVQLLDKAGIVQLGHKLNVPFELTHTCYKGQRPACGKCGACQERAEAFQLNGLVDPVAVGA